MTVEDRKALLALTHNALRDHAGDLKDNTNTRREIRNLGFIRVHLFHQILQCQGITLQELRPLLDPLLDCCSSPHPLANSLCSYRTILHLAHLLTLARKAKSTC